MTKLVNTSIILLVFTSFELFKTQKRGNLMKANTKERIWKEALTLFSQYGYEGVSVKQISNAVGIKDSSLYNHYKSKQDIFDTILVQITERIDEARNKLTIVDTSEMTDKYQKISLDNLSTMCYNLFSFYLNDELVCKFRKMLTIEQYANSNVGELFKKIFIDNVLDFETKLFSEFIKNGFFIKSDPYIMALHFYSPLFLLLFKCNSDDEALGSLKELIEKHVLSFAYCYTSKKGDNNESNKS